MGMFLLSTQKIGFGKKLVHAGVYCFFPSRSMFCLLKDICG